MPCPPQLYNNSHFALAALLPASLVSPQDGAIAKVADVGLAAAITVHNHVALNYGECLPGASISFCFSNSLRLELHVCGVRVCLPVTRGRRSCRHVLAHRG